MKPFFYLLLIPLLLACKSSDVNPFSSLSLIISDSLKSGNNVLTQASGASVSLFEDQHSFQSAASGNISSPIITQITTSDGSVSFSGLKAQPYWFYVTYESNGKAYNNSGSMYKLANPLTPSSNTTANVVLSQSPYNFYIQTVETNNGKLPFKVTLDTDTFTLTSSNAFTNPLYINKNPGTYTYKVEGNKGCIWTGTATTINQTSNTIPINLAICNSGLVTFWMHDSSSIYLPVNVVLNNTDVVGVINNSRSTAPSCTDTVNTANIYRGYNTYTYTAKSLYNGGCIITGKFIINAQDTCVQVQIIPQCN